MATIHTLRETVLATMASVKTLETSVGTTVGLDSNASSVTKHVHTAYTSLQHALGVITAVLTAVVPPAPKVAAPTPTPTPTPAPTVTVNAIPSDAVLAKLDMPALTVLCQAHNIYVRLGAGKSTLRLELAKARTPKTVAPAPAPVVSKPATPEVPVLQAAKALETPKTMAPVVNAKFSVMSLNRRQLVEWLNTNNHSINADTALLGVPALRSLVSKLHAAKVASEAPVAPTVPNDDVLSKMDDKQLNSLFAKLTTEQKRLLLNLAR